MKRFFILFLIFFITCGNTSEISTIETTTTTSTTIPTSTTSTKPQYEIIRCKSLIAKVETKVDTVFEILALATIQVVEEEDNGFDFQIAINTLENMTFDSDNGFKGKGLERELYEHNRYLKEIVKDTIRGLKDWEEGYNYYLEDGNDSRAEDKYWEGDISITPSVEGIQNLKSIYPRLKKSCES